MSLCRNLQKCLASGRTPENKMQFWTSADGIFSFADIRYLSTACIFLLLLHPCSITNTQRAHTSHPTRTHRGLYTTRTHTHTHSIPNTAHTHTLTCTNATRTAPTQHPHTPHTHSRAQTQHAHTPHRIRLCLTQQAKFGHFGPILTEFSRPFIHSLFVRYSLAIHSLSTRPLRASHALSTRYPLASHSLITRSPLALHSLSTRSPLALHSHFARSSLALQSLSWDRTAPLFSLAIRSLFKR
jgi:hypothetical protein